MARTADPDVRLGLIDAAARLIAGHGALTTRRLADEVGVSTMAVYTHFGSMDDLRRAVRAEGFARLAARHAEVPRTDDPVADLTALGVAYGANGMENASLYRVMFFEAPVDADDAQVGAATFEPVVDVVRRCVEAGRFVDVEPEKAAKQLWTMTHGLVSVGIAGLVSPDEMTEVGTALAENLYVGLGDQRSSARQSIQLALRWAQARV
jgi:AcrR family transcriptional regulator